MSKLTVPFLREMKPRGERIAMLTAYDYYSAQLVDDAGVHVILVGDSLGMVVLGYETTVPVTMDDMLHHLRAVARAKPRALVVGDLPYRTYETADQALHNSRRFIEAGADAVKLEGGELVAPIVRALVDAGILVLGHIGLLPQAIEKMGGYKVQGKTPENAAQLVRDAQALEAAGAFGVVIECVVADVARQITAAVQIPTIGIGAGVHCDGQVLVFHDLLGLGERIPKHARRYADLAAEMRRAFAAYRHDVEAGNFPAKNESFGVEP